MNQEEVADISFPHLKQHPVVANSDSDRWSCLHNIS